jgi:energy-coupling factor transporter ATP-binding protein EcfA2
MAAFQRLNRENGLTIVLVTHDADVAGYADRVVTFRDGRIVGEKRRRLDHSGVGAPRRATHVAPRGALAEPISAASPSSCPSRLKPATVPALRYRRIRSRRVMAGALAAGVLVAVGIGVSHPLWPAIFDIGDIIAGPRGEPPRQAEAFASPQLRSPQPNAERAGRATKSDYSVKHGKQNIGNPGDAPRATPQGRSRRRPPA